MQTVEDRRRSTRPISTPDVTAFLSVILVVLFIFMTVTGPHSHVFSTPIQETSVDLARVYHPISVPAANREDAVVITVYRDGIVRYGRDRIQIQQIPELVQKSISNGAPTTVFIKADARTRYGRVHEVVDEVRLTGIGKVVFLVEERKAPGSVF